MRWRVCALFLLLLLAGCAELQTPPWFGLQAGQADTGPGTFHFGWQIQGDAGVAPLQVFDDGRRVWLQYPADQAAPAIFARGGRGDRLRVPVRRGDYLIVEGVDEHLVVRGGHLLAELHRQAGAQAAPPPAVPLSSAAPDAAQASPVALPHAVAPAALAPSDAAVPATPTSTQLLAASDTMAPAPSRPAAGQAPAASHTTTAAAAAPAAPSLLLAPVPRVPTVEFSVSPADGNMRKALLRWARAAGWSFEAEHWAVDVDIPLAGSATFGGEFRPAVRSLLAATELGERPLQPCFYANRVLRVVTLAERCDRTAGAGAAS